MDSHFDLNPWRETSKADCVCILTAGLPIVSCPEMPNDLGYGSILVLHSSHGSTELAMREVLAGLLVGLVLFLGPVDLMPTCMVTLIWNPALCLRC